MLLDTELLVAQRPGAGPVARRVTPWDRVAVRLHALGLDRALARGESPEATVRLALRARQLVSMRARRDLAGGLRHALAARARDHVCRDRVRAAAAELQALADQLLTPAPLPAQGVAQASVLLQDGRGPLYRRSCRDDLRAQASRAVEALDPLASW